MNKITNLQIFKNQTEEITISDLRGRPGEVFTQVQMGKEFTVTKTGRVIARISKPEEPFDWAALARLRAGETPY